MKNLLQLLMFSVLGVFSLNSYALFIAIDADNDGDYETVIFDGGAGDLSAFTDTLLISQGFGIFNLTITADSNQTLDQFLLGETTLAVENTSENTGTLSIAIIESYSGLTATVNAVAVTTTNAADIGGISAIHSSSVTHTSYLGDGFICDSNGDTVYNGAGDVCSAVDASILSLTMTADGDGGVGGLIVTALETMYITHVATITLGAGEKVSYDSTTTVRVPEPGSLALLGLGLIGLGFVRRKQQS